MYFLTSTKVFRFDHQPLPSIHDNVVACVNVSKATVIAGGYLWCEGHGIRSTIPGLT